MKVHDRPRDRKTATFLMRLGRPEECPYIRWATLVLVFLSVGGSIALAVIDATGHQIDFDIYRMGAAHALGPHLYETRLPRLLMGGRRGMHFTYPPFAALLFWPFTRLSVTAGQLIWSLFNLGVLAALTALSIRALRPRWSCQRAWTIAAILLFPILRLNPDLLTLDYGQINFCITLMVLVDLICTIRVRSHELPRGMLVGIAAAVKLTPLIFIPFLLLTRQFKAGAAALATFLLCSLGAFAIAPSSSRQYWSIDIFDPSRSGNLLYISNQDLHSALQRIIGVTPPLALIASLTALCAIGGLVAAAAAYRASSPMLGILTCAATGLIISPVSWAHHYVWIVPALAWLVLGADRPRGGPWWAVATAAVFWAAPIWWVADPQHGYGGPSTLLAGNSYFLAAIALVAAAAARLMLRRPADPEEYAALVSAHG